MKEKNFVIPKKKGWHDQKLYFYGLNIKFGFRGNASVK